MSKYLTKLISLILSLSLILEQSVFAQSIDLSHYFVHNPSQAIPQSDKFRPLHLRSLGYDNLSQDFKLFLDKGDTKKEDLDSKAYIEGNTQTLLKYFFIGLALPNEKFWVNLRPDSPDNILDPDLEKTDIGRIFLEADLQLKKDTSSMTSPQTKEGREYWDKLYKKAGELFGSENITIPTITRPWIVPNEIIIREASDNAYIYKATLKVMLEEDYLIGRGGSRTAPTPDQYTFSDPRLKELNQYSTQLIKETIIPKLTYAVNTAKRYAPLRQVYYSLILAQWFKGRFLNRGNPKKEPSRHPENRPSTEKTVSDIINLIDSGNLANLTSSQAYDKQSYFQQYQKSFQDGEYNLQEPVYTPMGQSVRRYMSGGMKMDCLLAMEAGKIQAREESDFAYASSATVAYEHASPTLGGTLMPLAVDMKDWIKHFLDKKEISGEIKNGLLNINLLAILEMEYWFANSGREEKYEITGAIIERFAEFIALRFDEKEYSRLDYKNTFLAWLNHTDKDISEEEKLNMRGVVYEAFPTLEEILRLNTQAEKEGRKFIVVGNLSYGKVALAPITEQRGNDYFIKNSNIPVWHIKIGSTEHHWDPLGGKLRGSLAEGKEKDYNYSQIFNKNQLSFIIKEQPDIFIADASRSINQDKTHVPDSWKGVANIFTALNYSSNGTKKNIDGDYREFSVYELIVNRNDSLRAMLEARLEGGKGLYVLRYWYSGNKPHHLKEGLGTRLIKVNKIKQINGPTVIIGQTAIEPEAVPQNIQEFIGGVYVPTYYDDKNNFKWPYLKFIPGKGIIFYNPYEEYVKKAFDAFVGTASSAVENKPQLTKEEMLDAKLKQGEAEFISVLSKDKVLNLSKDDKRLLKEVGDILAVIVGGVIFLGHQKRIPLPEVRKTIINTAEELDIDLEETDKLLFDILTKINTTLSSNPSSKDKYQKLFAHAIARYYYQHYFIPISSALCN